MSIGFLTISQFTCTDLVTNQYFTLQNRLKEQLDKKNFKDADEIFQSLLVFRDVISTKRPFDARLEMILEKKEDPDRFIKAARLAIMMENGKVKTLFSETCLLVCYIHLGNYQAADKLKVDLLNDYKREKTLELDLEDLINVYSTTGNNEMLQLMKNTLKYINRPF